MVKTLACYCEVKARSWHHSPIWTPEGKHHQHHKIHEVHTAQHSSPNKHHKVDASNTIKSKIQTRVQMKTTRWTPPMKQSALQCEHDNVKTTIPTRIPAAPWNSHVMKISNSTNPTITEQNQQHCKPTINECDQHHRSWFPPPPQNISTTNATNSKYETMNTTVCEYHGHCNKYLKFHED